ncbi:hypothetical protein CWI36_0019p0020 [Hamiltosporidium magnivora]|uniref:Uncharacterized protein n=1 Tax=Hamiltosporidium magnivora TaxID=148818 RepID=A0A4Q9LMN2_9MICR|nr:hypothetical protein CWI36_0019p0020 [Hamiltosporidium magnivora]
MQTMMIFLGAITLYIFCARQLGVQQEHEYTVIRWYDNELAEMMEVKNTEEEMPIGNKTTKYESEGYVFQCNDNINDPSHKDLWERQFKFQSDEKKQKSSVKEYDSTILINPAIDNTFDEKPEIREAAKNDFLKSLLDQPVFISEPLDLSLSLRENHIDENAINTREIYLKNITNTIDSYIYRIRNDRKLFFTNIKGKLNLEDNLKILRGQAQNVFTAVLNNDFRSQSYNSSRISSEEILIRELNYIKEGDNIKDLKKIIECSEKIQVYEMQYKKTSTERQLQENLFRFKFKNIKEEIKKYKSHLIFYEFMIFFHLFEDNITDHIEEEYFLYILFLFEVLLIKVDNLKTKIKKFRDLSNDNLLEAYKNLSYEYKIGLEILPLKIILIQICFGFKNGIAMSKRFITVYLLEFTYLFMAGRKVILGLDDEFYRIIILPLYHYIYDDSLSLCGELYARIGNVLTILSKKEYNKSYDIYTSFSKIMDHISKKNLLKKFEISLKNLYSEFTISDIDYPECLRDVRDFLQRIASSILNFESLDHQEISSNINSCISYIYLLGLNIYKNCR